MTTTRTLGHLISKYVTRSLYHRSTNARQSAGQQRGPGIADVPGPPYRVFVQFALGKDTE